MRTAGTAPVGDSPQPHAEVVNVWPRGGYISVDCALHDVDTSAAGKDSATTRDCSAVLLLRENAETARTYTLRPFQASFRIELPIADLVPFGQFDRVYWDAYLSVNTGGVESRTRIGRHLDDIEDKKNVMVFPGQRVTSASRGIRVTPYYTDHNNLSIRVRQLQRSEAGT